MTLNRPNWSKKSLRSIMVPWWVTRRQSMSRGG